MPQSKTTMPLFHYSLICAIAIIIQACAPATTWIKDNNEGTVAIYRMPHKVVWDTVPSAIKELGLTPIDADKKNGIFFAQGKMSALSHGEKVSIFVEKVDDDKTKVKVISKRIWRNETASENWEDPLLNSLAELLGTPRLNN